MLVAGRLPFLNSCVKFRSITPKRRNFAKMIVNTPVPQEDQDNVKINLAEIQLKVSQAAKGRNVRLVAVSKTKPVALVKACYDTGHRVFGENYVQELLDKAPELPRDIKWHFIGGLQSNKAKKLLEIENLAMVESIDSVKLAQTLDKAAAKRQSPLPVMIQVNTSAEESKNGVEPGKDVIALVELILTSCKNLRFTGLMTIGSPEAPPERDFQKLVDCKREVVTRFGLDASKVELSMGMSHDFEQAIALGATNVRVGSSIFGARQAKH